MKFSNMAALAGGFLILGACGGGSSLGGLDAEATYVVALNSAGEVPTPKATSATGTATIIVYSDRIQYQLTATNIIGITMAHIHNGAPGIAGPVVVTLYMPGTPSGGVSGIFANGTITASDLPAGTTFDALKTLILGGNAYVNVRTTANPAGEIRGQIR